MKVGFIAQKLWHMWQVSLKVICVKRELNFKLRVQLLLK